MIDPFILGMLCGFGLSGPIIIIVAVVRAELRQRAEGSAVERYRRNLEHKRTAKFIEANREMVH